MSATRMARVLALVTVAAAGCGAPTVEVTGPGPSASSAADAPAGFDVVDEQMDLTDEQRAALVANGMHGDGLLQGQPLACRVAEGAAGSDGELAARIVAELDPGVDRGPVVVMDAEDGMAVLGTTLVAADGQMGQVAAWAADLGGDVVEITAATTTAADLTPFPLDVIDTAGEGPEAHALAGATDCSWGAADLTHADPPEPAPSMRPDLLVLDPATARPGQVVAMRFPEETARGIAFQLDRQAGDGWETVAWMTSDGNGDDPVTVPAGSDGYGVVDVGVGGPGPDHVRLPVDVAPGTYRICTANAGDEFCAPLTIAP